MTDFDQIIKEKVEQKEYAYSAFAWHSFVQKAGLKSALTASQSVLIAVVSVAVISVGSWLGIRYMTQSQEAAPAPEVTVEEIPEPTLSIADTTVEEILEETVSIIESPSPVHKTNEPKVTNEAPKETITDTIAESKPTRKPILRPKNPRRILEINTDTIKSNE